MKEATGGPDTGCKPQSSSAAPGPGVLRLMLSEPGGSSLTQTLTIVDGMIQFECRNMTMAAFAAGLRGMIGTNLGQTPVTDQTGITGQWNFDLRWSLGLMPIALNGADQARITPAEAIEKQMGLKLEEREVPTAVLVVESVNRKPSANPPGTADALPPVRPPTEFEVAVVKPSGTELRGSRFQMQPGGQAGG
jgi:uncharacterized protein (TIGR03435 family)